MYRITLLLMYLFVFLPITLCYASVLKAPNTPVATHKQLSVCGTHLCNHENKPVQLVGMSTHGLQWYGWGKCLTAKSLDVLAEDWEVDIVRLSLYVQEGGYESDPEGFTQQVQSLIKAVSQRGLYVLIDWHQLTPGDPNFNLSLAKRFFKDIAQANAHRNNLLYDIANEPNRVTWQAIYRYANEMIPWIRQYDKKAPILVGTHGWSTFGLSDGQSLQDILSLPIPYDNIMYTFHFYAASHGQHYRNILKEAAQRLPIFVTEWGTQTYTGDGLNDFDSARAYIQLMNQHKISWINWNYSDDFRSGAVWQPGTCLQNSNWGGMQLKQAGHWIKNQIKITKRNRL